MLEALGDRRFELVASWQLAEEAADVLRRPKLRRYEIGERDVDDVLQLLAPSLPAAELQVPIRDEHDAPVVTAALAGVADAIVTDDRNLLADSDLRRWLAARGVSVLTPSELLDEPG